MDKVHRHSQPTHPELILIHPSSKKRLRCSEHQSKTKTSVLSANKASFDLYYPDSRLSEGAGVVVLCLYIESAIPSVAAGHRV